MIIFPIIGDKVWSGAPDFNEKNRGKNNGLPKMKGFLLQEKFVSGTKHPNNLEFYHFTILLNSYHFCGFPKMSLWLPKRVGMGR